MNQYIVSARKLVLLLPRGMHIPAKKSIKLERARDLLQQVLRAKNCENGLGACCNLRKRMV
jgi:hypothetical protein